MAEARKPNRTQDLLQKLNIEPLTFLDPNLPSGYLSHSQYGAYKLCGWSYYLERVEKRVKEFNKTPNMGRGTAVHSGVEYTLLAKMAHKVLSMEEGIEVVAKSFEEEAKDIKTWDEGTDAGRIKDTAINLFRVFYNHALPKINPVAIEKGFAKMYGDVPMIGWIDLVDEQSAIVVPSLPAEIADLGPKKHVTVDFKTGTAKWSQNELDKDTQLTMYSMVEGTPDIRVDQFIHLKNGPQYVRGESTRTPQDGAVFVEDVNEVAEFIKKGVFPKANIDSWKCCAKFCPFWADCRGKQKGA